MNDQVDNQAGGAEGGEAVVTQTGLACFVTLLNFLKVNADPQQLQHELGKGGVDTTLEDMMRLAKVLKVRAKVTRPKTEKLPTVPLPAIAEAMDGSFFIVGQAAEGQVLHATGHSVV